eukprot:tig00000056_g24080.t1
MVYGWLPEEGLLYLGVEGRTEWPAAEIARAGPENIRTLVLSGNSLTRIPGAELAKLTKLEGLGLSNNLLTALPPEISRLAALQHLQVHGNPVVDSWPEPVRRAVNENSNGQVQCAAVVPYLRSLAAPARAPAPRTVPPAPQPPAPPPLRLQVRASPFVFALQPRDAGRSGSRRGRSPAPGGFAGQLEAAAARLREEARAAALAEARAEALAGSGRLAEAEAARLRAEERAAQAQERLSLYEAGSAAATPGGGSWGEAELAAAAERLQAATRRVEELRIAARAAALNQFECPVCWDEKERGERRLLHPCGHVVCAACVQRLAGGAGTCPICREPFGGSVLIFD